MKAKFVQYPLSTHLGSYRTDTQHKYTVRGRLRGSIIFSRKKATSNILISVCFQWRYGFAFLFSKRLLSTWHFQDVVDSISINLTLKKIKIIVLTRNILRGCEIYSQCVDRKRRHKFICCEIELMCTTCVGHLWRLCKRIKKYYKSFFFAN